MSLVQSTTGHSASEERFVAKELYVTILFVILVALAVVFVVSQHPSSNLRDNYSPTPAQAVPGRTAPLENSTPGNK